MVGDAPRGLILAHPRDLLGDLAQQAVAEVLAALPDRVDIWQVLMHRPLAAQVEGVALAAVLSPAVCAQLARTVEQLLLGGNGLVGTIPGASVGRLARLKNLRLGGNKLVGPVPVELALLARLEKVELFKNKLEGGIPAGLAKCGKLKVLNLSGNALSGVVPTGLFDTMPELEKVQLFNNKLEGGIPAGLAKCTKLTLLSPDDDMIARSTDTITKVKAALPNLEVQ